MQLRTEIEIDAPPDAVWAVLSATDRYAEWNPFVTELKGALAVGSRLEIVVAPPDSSEMRFRPRVLVSEPGRELRWRGVLGHRLLFSGEHFFQLVDTGRGSTRFVHGEDFEGLLLRFLGQKLTNTARGFVLMNQALKRRVEGLAARSETHTTTAR